MDKTIAVESNLLRVGRYLECNGYDIVDLDNINRADMVVISGGSKDFLGHQDSMTARPVIDATGLSVHDVLLRVKSYH
ncbi:Uncharacterised protein family (UPF0180) [Desulfonispora thiosulfatigenes DSM 11270]|uniref:Uncharacterized protein family (UPF0180) n=1 Tax=Desulfonispora thiosulfatigenes DSM 11270 TaxID=656914 RepID=A0A1W1V2M4_DESTI|nr:YkuS family protein [Desulfonispora thiosulfatigenes]SMB87572.1 Uncharacterised protein family (UPF0180) [Desulfonispora thiosulfatigenes DSM 11270]